MGPLPALGAEEAATSAASQGKVESTIAITSDTATDSRIKLRVRQLFATIDGLQDVDVAVNGGVVVLTGIAASKAVHEQAIRLAQRVEGVVDIRDRIEASRDLRRRIAQLSDRLTAQFLSFVGYLPLLLVAAVVVATFWWIAQRIATSRVVARHLTSNPFLRDFVRQLIRVAVTGLGLLLALQVLDASTLVGSVLGAAGVIGLALGFALRDTVENYIASLLLSLRQPFSRDDLVTIEGFEGRIVRLTARATILMTLDGNHTRIPNAKVYKAIIVNYTRNPRRRFQFEVGVDTEQNLAAAQALAATTVAQMDGILAEPPPSCTVQLLGDSNVILRVFGWIDQREAEFLKVRSEAIRLVKGAFDRAGVVMPEPIYNVRVGPGSATSGFATTPDSTGSPSSTTSGVRAGGGSEPLGAIDIAPRDELKGQIAADYQPDDEDLLRNHAPKE
ncbi:MAG: mechanosensitive ion channel domain-containing protein [Casimicrobiaceae bacterium]